MKRARIKPAVTVPARRKAKELVENPSKDGNDIALENVTPLKHSHTLETQHEIVPESNQEPIRQSVSEFLPEATLEFVPESLRESEKSETANVQVQHILPNHSSNVEATRSNEDKIVDHGLIDENNENSEPEIVKTSKTLPSRVVEVSPTKSVNRSCFMRPTPRLDGGGRIRRNSIQGSGASASESEDDCRKSIASSRVRNDSICSIQSNKEGSISNSKLNLGTKRRTIVSESARKLAESRKEFLLKHENETPERSKLTMYDLLYYNPSDNPMTSQANTVTSTMTNTVTSTVTRKMSICSSNEREAEEAVDEPEEMMVPRVKVGPDGQLIIDEQSLIIDKSKALESIDRSEIIVDNGTNGGFYKRRPKSKDWSKWETIKFYKALNAIGTDFLLMQSIFPNRSRHELKLKYKKEEKINYVLVEKALRYQEFDTEALEVNLALVEENERLEAEEMKKRKDKNKELNKNLNKKKRTKSSRSRLVTTSIELLSDDEFANWGKPDTDEELTENVNPPDKKPKKRAVRKRKTLLESANGNAENSRSSGSEPEVYNPQPTRSGRASRKSRKLQAPDLSNLDNSLRKKDRTLSECSSVKSCVSSSQALHAIADVMPDVNSIEPGSLVILSKESSVEPGKTVMQVYVVSSNYDPSDPNSKQNMTPINLSPDLLQSVTSHMKEVVPQPDS